MKRNLLVAAALACVLTAGHWAWAQQSTVVQGDAVKWGPRPPALPSGAQQSVLVGDPRKEGGYVVRLKLPAGVVGGAVGDGSYTGQILRHTPYPPAPSSETTWHSPKLKVSVAL